jgi:hypothetical protein
MASAPTAIATNAIPLKLKTKTKTNDNNGLTLTIDPRGNGTVSSSVWQWRHVIGILETTGIVAKEMATLHAGHFAGNSSPPMSVDCSLAVI